MREEIEKLREACRSLADERQLAALSRVSGAPPYRTLQDFVSGAAPSSRTLVDIEESLKRLAAQGGQA